MFYNCYKLSSIDISKFIFKDSAAMQNMTRGCYSLTSLNFQNPTPIWLYFEGSFYDCPNLNFLNFTIVRNTIINFPLFNGNISDSGTIILKKDFYNRQNPSFKESIPSDWNLILLD